MKISCFAATAAFLTVMTLQTAVSQNDGRPRPLVSDNYGLRAPQDPATLPRSAVPVVWPELKAKTVPVTRLDEIADATWRIRGGWELAESDQVVSARGYLFDPSYDTSQWYNATVPGTVLTTLVDQGVYPDPYYGVNNMSIPDDLCRKEWWYRTSLELPAGSDGKRVWLLFEGINYRADVWLNGHLLGDIRGAFIRGRFDVTDFVDKQNVLAVRIYPPNNPGIPHEQSATALRGPNGGQLCLDGPTFISSEGWDWIPGMRDRNIGIWQDVYLQYTGDVTLGDFQVVTDLPLPDTSYADVAIRGDVENHSASELTVSVSAAIEDITVSKEITIAANNKLSVTFKVDEFPELRIKQPRLWWPNGYGTQELYHAQLCASDPSGGVSDSKNIRFGIREVSYETTVDAPHRKEWRVEYSPTKAQRDGAVLFDNTWRRDIGNGVSITRLREGVETSLFTQLTADGTAPYLVIKVNGVRIFCKGGNWGMDDGMKRVSRERLEPYLRLHKDANFNMIRNWTGESTEREFYELCDEYGMLVWNDFWMSTEGYNLNPNDEDLFMENAVDVVRRYINHPSIVVWCPRNEGYAPPELEERLNRMIAEQDGTRHYHANSRYLNLRPSGGWYLTALDDYFSRQAQGFNTELGTGSIPRAETMRKFMAEEDLWPVGGDVWHFHDLHFGLDQYRNALDTLYGTATDIDDFCRKAQMLNYDSHRAMFEAWNSRLWDSACGLLLWMSHPAWPSVVWQTYSWDYETFGSYFGSMKGCEPVHIQMDLDTDRICIVNTSNESISGARAILTCYDFNGRVLMKKEHRVEQAPANSLTSCFTAELDGIQGLYLARVELRNRKGEVLSLNDYIKAGKGESNLTALNTLDEAKPTAKLKRTESGNGRYRTVLEISNPGKTTAIAVKLNVRDRETGQAILPAFFSDGYFNLLPGERRTVEVDYATGNAAYITAEGYNVPAVELLQL